MMPFLLEGLHREQEWENNKTSSASKQERRKNKYKNKTIMFDMLNDAKQYNLVGLELTTRK